MRTDGVLSCSLCRPRAPQSGRWYHKDWRSGTDAEVLVLALLVARSEGDGIALSWANEVLAHADGYADGKPFTRPASTPIGIWQKLIGKFVDELITGITSEEAGAIIHAVGVELGENPLFIKPTETEIRKYVHEFSKKPDEALLGIGGSGKTYKKGAPLRRSYLMPRVARLVSNNLDKLAHALGGGRAAAVDDADGVVARSPPKAFVKAELAELKGVVTQLEGALVESAAARATARGTARKTKERLAAARSEFKKDDKRRVAAADARAKEHARAAMATAERTRDAALERAHKAELENQRLRKAVSRLRSRASDPAALRAKNAELAALRAENTAIRRDNAKLDAELVSARAALARALTEYGEVWVPHRPRGAGAGRGRAHDAKLRRTYAALMAEGLVSSAKLNTVFTICAEAMCLRKCEREMKLPNEQFGNGLRAEMGATHRMVAGRALEAAERIASLQEDGSPLEQDDFEVAPMQLDEVTPDGRKCRRRWCGVGAFQIADKSGKGEAEAIKSKVFDRLVDAVAAVKGVLEKKYGVERANEIIASRNGGVSVTKLVGGVTSTDNASAATKMQTELHKIVAAEVRERMGAEEYDTLSPDEQRKLTKAWCVC